MGLAILALALLALPAIYLRDGAKEKRKRGDWFVAALPLFASYRVTQEGRGWPVLTGDYRGHDVRLEPVMDDLAWRKLPSLWLKVTVLVAQPSRGTLGFLVRARGAEFYSPTADMLHRLVVPAHWPSDAILCTDDGQTAPVAALDSQIAGFADPRMKEAVITPLGVRLVYQAAQGSRAEYLVLRQARFLEDRADPQLLRDLLDRAIAIAEMADTTRLMPVAA